VTAQVPTVVKVQEHPNMIEEDDTVVRKCRKDAINNATRIMATATTPLLGITSTMPLLENEKGGEKSIKGFMEIYKIPLGILALVVILILVYLIYSFVASRNSQ
jgi:hypothetical protein